MKRILLAAALAAACISPAWANGYPGHGKAIDDLKPAADYSQPLSGRPLALGIMRARANGFVPSVVMQGYVNGVLARLLRGVNLPPSFQPQVRVLAAPEFSALCTPDGTIIITIGLLEQLDNEDELAFILGHEVSHAIYRHHENDWFKKAQYYGVIDGASAQGIADAAALAGAGSSDVGRALDVAVHLQRLSANVLAPQMTQNQEDAADALGFDLMIKAGYDPEAAMAVMDKLAEQEAEAAAEARAAQAATSGGGGHHTGFGDIMGVLGNAASGNWKDVAIFAFDTAVDNMSTEAVAHHPAPERARLLSTYAFKNYRDTLPSAPTALPWSEGSKSKDGIAMTALLAHYAAAENAAAYIADPNQGSAQSAHDEVARSSTAPTSDHAYTQYVAYEYYDKNGQKPMSEAALTRAANGPEPSWEIYSRLIDVHIARNDWAGAQHVMDQAVMRLEDSPVLLPKRIQIRMGAGDTAGAQALIPKCKSYDIKELTNACQKAAGAG
jgi:Zn-dependent protease with chaperone function